MGSPRYENRRRSWERRGGQTHRDNEAVYGCVEEQAEEQARRGTEKKGVILVRPQRERRDPPVFTHGEVEPRKDLGPGTQQLVRVCG